MVGARSDRAAAVDVRHRPAHRPRQRRATTGGRTRRGSGRRRPAGLLDGVDIVVVRILGGYRAWQDGLDAVLAAACRSWCSAASSAPDAELMEHSTVPGRRRAEAHGYLAQGGPDEPAAAARASSPTRVLLTGDGFEPPVPRPAWGVLRADRVADDRRPDGRGALLPRPAPGRQHRLRRGAVPRDRGTRAAGRCRSSARRCAPPSRSCSTLLGTADALVVTVLAAAAPRPPTAHGRRRRRGLGRRRSWPRSTSRSCRGCA